MPRRFTVLESFWRFRVADDIGKKIHHRNDDAVFHFAIAQVVQIRLPMPVLGQIFRYMPQSITRCAVLIPAPAMFSRLFTSAT